MKEEQGIACPYCLQIYDGYCEICKESFCRDCGGDLVHGHCLKYEIDELAGKKHDDSNGKYYRSWDLAKSGDLTFRVISLPKDGGFEIIHCTLEQRDGDK